MVLVDTSVWIRFLANRAPYAAELDRLLEGDDVAGHGLVDGELLIGDPAGSFSFSARTTVSTGSVRASCGGRGIRAVA